MQTDFPSGGYHRRLLRVDLSSGITSVEEIDADLLRHYLGGTGLGIHILYHETPPGMDPFDPQNRLIFATGPFTGTLIPGSGTYAVISKSPLTGLAAVAQANGHFGARLKAAGFDAVIVQGRADRSVYLFVENGRAALLPADGLAGKGAIEVDRILRSRHGEDGIDYRFSTAAIGPAGESKVRFAAICSDRGHVAASGGLGAVMGSKNLKALAVLGDGGVPLSPDGIAAFKAAVVRWREESSRTGLGKTVHTKGTLGLFKPYYDKGWVPIKNLTSNQMSDQELEQFDWENIRNRLYLKIPRACHACSFNHCHSVKIKTGRYKGFVGEEPEYEILAGFGSNLGIADPGAVTMLNHLNDDLGMDAKEVSFLISMLMEGVDKDIIDSAALDGIPLAWGAVDAVVDLLQKISRREGIGDLLAEGVMRVAKTLGAAFDDLAVYVKHGNAPHVHDPRTRWGTLFTQIISNTASQEGVDMTSRANPELGFNEPTSEPDEYLAAVQAKTGPKRQFEECLVFCYFQACSFKHMVHTLNVLTGGSFTTDGCLTLGERVVNLLRMYNIREGLTAAHDSYSPRLGQSPVDGPGQGKSLTPTFDRVRNAYYQKMGWDENGIPQPDTLKRLNLEFTLEAGQQ